MQLLPRGPRKQAAGVQTTGPKPCVPVAPTPSTFARWAAMPAHMRCTTADFDDQPADLGNFAYAISTQIGGITKEYTMEFNGTALQSGTG